MANLNDEILDLLLKRDLILQRVSNGLSKEVAQYYKDLINNAISTIKEYDEITIVKMNKLIKEINSKIDYPYSEIEPKFNDLATVEASYIPTGINALVGIDIVNKVLPPSIVERILKNSVLPDGHFVKDAFDIVLSNFKNNIKGNIQKIVNDDLQSGILSGTPASRIVNNLKPLFEDLTKNKLDSLVKTSISTITNNVRMEVYKENEDIFKGWEHHSTLDGRVRYEHFLLNTAMWDFKGKGLNEKGKKYEFKPTPRGWRCRCILLPIVKSFKELGIDLEEIPIGKRASMNGEVARDITAEEWFDKQDKKFQEKYLGIKRYELFKQGKITLSDLVSQKGETLTIDELKKLG